MQPGHDKEKPAGISGGQRADSGGAMPMSTPILHPNECSRQKTLADTIIPERVPGELLRWPQWVAYAIEARAGKPTKVPKNPHTGGNAMADNPSTWGTFGEAVALAIRRRLRGVGFELGTGGTRIVGLDFDHCRDAHTGQITPEVQRWIRWIDSYTEVTQSRQGVRIFALGNLPPEGRKHGDIEMYQGGPGAGRFLTVTGWHLEGTPCELCERASELAQMHEAIFTRRPAAPRARQSPKGYGPQRTDAGHMDDAELLKRMGESRVGTKILALFAGHWRQMGYKTHSEADLALCGYLAYWTQNDAGAIDQLFRQSGLMRAKWDDVHRGDKATYGAMTIARALEDRR